MSWHYDIARLFNPPTILTTSFEDGPNGPLVPELKEMFRRPLTSPAPATSTPGTFQDFVKAVKATGKKQPTSLAW